MSILPSRLLFIAELDEKGTAFPSMLRAALEGGCRWVMLRGIGRDPQLLLSAALYAKKLCADHGAKFFISREAALAKRIKADGIHVASDVPAQRFHIPGMLLGQSCHNEKELRFAEQSRVDYITLSPVFPSLSKPGYGPPLGPGKLKSLIAKTSLPVVALGGVTPENAAACLEAGAAAIAVMGGISQAHHVRERVESYGKALKDLNQAA